MRTFIFIISLIYISTHGFTQTKFEKESRVKINDVPTVAVEYVNTFNFQSKVKWYKETCINSISFEAKTKHNGNNYSIEFSEDGSFEDIEIEIKSKEISPEFFKIISNYLTERHKKYSIKKIQIQYIGEKSLISDFIKNQNKRAEIQVNYEIVISSKEEGSFKMFEYLFSEKGDFIKRAQIELKRT